MKKKRNIVYMVIIFLLTVLVLFKLFLNDRYQGHDTIFHVANIIKLSETISFDNIFGLNLISYEFNKFGYGIWLFYPKLPHLSAAYIYLIIKDIYLSMKIVYFITTLLSGIFMYYLSNKIYDNRKIALISSVMYITVPYHICEIYIRDAFSENYMFLVLPMIFLGLYNLKDNNYLKFYILFILGYIIGMNSHLCSMFFCTIFIAIFILYYHKDFLKKDKIKALVISAIIVTGMMLPYLTTLMEHKSLNIYRVFTENFSSLREVQLFSLDFSSLFIQKPTLDNIQPYFSITTIVLFILTTIYVFFNKNNKYKKDSKIFFILIVIIVTVVCSKVLWECVPALFLSIQFPWRLLVFLSLIISLYSPLILINEKIPKLIRNILFTIIVCLLSFEGIINTKYYKNEEVSVNEAMKSSYALGYQREYFPEITVEGLYLFLYAGGNNYLKEYEITVYGKGEVQLITDDFPYMKFVVDNVDKNTIVEMPRIYYLGYKLINEKNEEIDLYNSGFGFVAANINDDGVYELIYEKTDLCKLAEFIRLFMILIIVVVLVVKFIKWKKEKK